MAILQGVKLGFLAKISGKRPAARLPPYYIRHRTLRHDLSAKRGSLKMKTTTRPSTSLASLALSLLLSMLLLACASKPKDTGTPSGSNDILDLLTGFGESISKRDYVKAVGYMTPSERSLMLDGSGQVPEDKQKALAALRLSRLIRMPGVHVENGYLAGIYEILPSDQASQANVSTSENQVTSEEAPAADASQETEVANTQPAEGDEQAEVATSPSQQGNTLGTAQSSPELTQAVNKFFKAVTQKNWNAALAMMNDDERKILTDDRGKIKEASKARLQHIDSEGKDALTLQDGKLTGVTLLLPAD
jgi:hypothetical protein